MAYSMDLRRRVIADCDAGLGTKAVALKYSVSPAWVRRAIESVGASVLYLPPYSPDLNPIEPAFSKVKRLLRSEGHRAAKALWCDVQRMLDTITTSDAEGYFRHCGYTLRD